MKKISILGLFALSTLIAGVGANTVSAAVTFSSTAITGDGALAISTGATQALDIGLSATTGVITIGSVSAQNVSIADNNWSIGVSGAGTLTSLALNGNLVLNGATSGTVTFTVPATITSYTYTWPATQGGVGTILQNDGAGGLSWSTAGAGDMTLAGVQTITGAKTFNSGKLLLAGSISGAITLNAPAVAGSGTVTLPASGTLITDSVTTLSSLVSVGTITTGVWSADTIAVNKGGTGVTSFGGANTLLYTTSTNTLSSIASGNNGVLVTNGSGAPSISSTLPDATQDNITRLGTVASGVWNGTDIAVAAGGTGAGTASGARTNLGLAIGSDVQAFDSTLGALASFNSNGVIIQTAADTFVARTLTGTANQVIIANGDGASGNPTLSLPQNIHTAATPTFGGLILSGATSGTTTLNAASIAGSGTVTLPTSGTLVNDAVTTLSSLASVGTITTGVWNGTDVAVADGGTGASTAAGARSNLSAAVSGANSDITSLAGLTTALSVAQGGTGATTAAAARTNLSAATVYQNQNIKTTAKIWTASATTSSGVATFNPTDDNTGSGNAIFTNIYSIQAIAANNTGTATSVPLASIKLLSADKKSLTINVIKGTVLSVLGSTIVTAPDDTSVYVTIIGD